MKSPHCHPMHPLILGVFAYLDSVPEDSMPEGWEAAWKYRDQPERRRKQKLADFINILFRLQSRECPLRPLLAGYRLYFRDDMALALAHAYMLHKDGKDPEEALTADYCPGFEGLLTFCNLDEYWNAKAKSHKARLWRHFSRYYAEGDRFVKYHRPHSIGYLLFRGDRLVWRYEAYHLSPMGPSLRWKTDAEKFEELGGNKGFLNGDFTWPPPDWINPVTDEQQEAYFEEHRVRFVPRSSLNYPTGNPYSIPKEEA